eukprot:3938192-Rhodomonas_salina.1
MEDHTITGSSISTSNAIFATTGKVEPLRFAVALPRTFSHGLGRLDLILLGGIPTRYMQMQHIQVQPEVPCHAGPGEFQTLRFWENCHFCSDHADSAAVGRHYFPRLHNDDDLKDKKIVVSTQVPAGRSHRVFVESLSCLWVVPVPRFVSVPVFVKSTPNRCRTFAEK